MKEYIFSYIKGELQESRNSWSYVVLHIQCLLHPTWLYSASFQTYFSPYFRNLCDFGVIWFFLISIKSGVLKYLSNLHPWWIPTYVPLCVSLLEKVTHKWGWFDKENDSTHQYWFYNFVNTPSYFCFVFAFVWELSIIKFLVHFLMPPFCHNYSPGCYSWSLNLLDLFSLAYLVSYNEVSKYLLLLLTRTIFFSNIYNLIALTF